jgi:DNA-binding beta-propeller fold protein YncE
MHHAKRKEFDMSRYSISALISRKLLAIACPLLLLALLAGCSTPDVCRYVADKPLFFPLPPDEPHIQYLTGINSMEDIGEGKKKGSSISLFKTAAPEVIKKIGKAYGIDTHKGKIYVAEGMNGRIDILDPARGTFESPPGILTPRGVLKYPVNTTVDDEGNLYVADTVRKEIIVYDAAGNFTAALPEKFDANSKIVDVKVFDGKLYTLDLGSSRIRVLDRKTGAQISEFGYIEQPNQSVRLPSNLAMDAVGNMYVTNIGNNLITKYDRDGHFLGSFGGSGDAVGKFIKPKGIALGPEGFIYVVDGGGNVVQVFDEKFRLLTYFGWPGLPVGSLSSPAGIAITTDNLEYFKKFAAPGFKMDYLIFVVSQFGQEFCIPRISVYGFGQMQKK